MRPRCHATPGHLQFVRAIECPLLERLRRLYRNRSRRRHVPQADGAAVIHSVADAARRDMPDALAVAVDALSAPQRRIVGLQSKAEQSATKRPRLERNEGVAAEKGGCLKSDGSELDWSEAIAMQFGNTLWA